MTTNLAERTATPMELASHSARMLPSECGARAGYACDGRSGTHLARYAQAHRLDYVTADQMAAVSAAAEVITNDRIIPGGAR